MAIVHIVVLTAALLALVVLPCALMVLLHLDENLLRQLQARHSGRRLDRGLRRLDPVRRLAELDAPSIEQIAYDLRRLDRQRRTGPTLYSEVWLAAVLRAYDDRLRLACHCLGVTEHLQPLEGMDREIERLRVEAQLQAAGLSLRGSAS